MKYIYGLCLNLDMPDTDNRHNTDIAAQPEHAGCNIMLHGVILFLILVLISVVLVD